MKFYPDKLYAFDLDGTLVSCKEKQLFVWRLALPAIFSSRTNLELFWSEKLMGKRTKDILLNLEIDEEKICIAQNYFKKNIENLEFQFLDKPTMLLDVISRKLKHINIISARQFHDLAEIQVNNIIPANLTYSLITVTHTAVIEEKASVIRKLGIDTYVGDTELDYQASQMAGVRFQFMPGGQRTRKFVMSHKI